MSLAGQPARRLSATRARTAGSRSLALSGPILPYMCKCGCMKRRSLARDAPSPGSHGGQRETAACMARSLRKLMLGTNGTTTTLGPRTCTSECKNLTVGPRSSSSKRRSEGKSRSKPCVMQQAHQMPLKASMSSTCCTPPMMQDVGRSPKARRVRRRRRREPWRRRTNLLLSMRVAGSECDPPMGHPPALQTGRSPTSMP
eukprot:10769235-Alexandrium_andersonii.AAC.1